MQSFIAGLRGNIQAARQYMNLWAIQRDAAMDGEDVSRLVATAFLKHANLDVGIADYRHLAAYFDDAIKQSYCTKFPIDETSEHSSTTAAQQYANCSNDDRFMDSQQMYTYRLAAEAWHRLLQLDQSSVRNCRNTTLAKCGGEAQHLEKLEVGSLPGLPNVQSSTARGKTPRIEVFLVSLERS